MMIDLPPREFDAFGLQPYGHKDMVESTEFNFYGNRYATGSADGRITVYNRHSKDGAWHLCDVWGAHKGEILEVLRIVQASRASLTIVRSIGYHRTYTPAFWARYLRTASSDFGEKIRAYLNAMVDGSTPSLTVRSSSCGPILDVLSHLSPSNTTQPLNTRTSPS